MSPLGSISDAVIGLDADWRITHLNAVAAHQLGRAADSLVGRHAWTELPDELGAPLQQACERVMRERVAERVALHHPARGQWLEHHLYPTRDGGLLMLSCDVTEQRALVEKLRRSERRFHALTRATPGIVSAVNEDGISRGPVPEFEALTGLPGDAWLDAVHPGDRERLVAQWEARRVDEPYSSEYRLRRADGAWRRMRIRGAPVLDDEGRVLEWVLVNADITEEHDTQAELRDSVQRLALVFNSSFDSKFLVSVEPGGRFRLGLVNPAFTRITGISAESVVGRELGEIERETGAVIRLDRYREVVRTRRVVEYEERYDLGDRTQVMETRLVPVLGPGDEVTHVLGNSRDISERRRLEEERKALDLQLLHAQKLESLGVLAGGVAHDFNNLLVGILGNASLALLDLPAGTPVTEAVSDIEKTARQAAELTNQLLAYSGHGRFVVLPLDVGRLVTEMSPVLRSALTKRAQVTLELAEGLPSVEGDASQLRQVVLNMVTNASDALGEGAGRITVRTGVEEVDEAALRASRFAAGARAGEFVYVEVEDDGCGMDEATVERIFEPFFTTKFTGRGLGLAATLGIVRGHRGVIRVTSAPGRGTTFRVALPARRDLASPRRTPGGSSIVPGAGTVLVIDDEQSVRIAMRRILSRAGYQVLEASEGAEGIAIARERGGALDCVVVDLTMPGLGGVEVANAIRGELPGVRLVMVSGYDAGSVTGLPAGSHEFLQKPFTAAQLVGVVSPRHGS